MAIERGHLSVVTKWILWSDTPVRGRKSTLPNPYFYFVFVSSFSPPPPQTHTFTERGLGGLAGGHCCRPRGRRPLAGLLGRGKGDPQLSTQWQQPHTPSTQ